MADQGYGEESPNTEGGSSIQYTPEYWRQNILYRQSQGYPLSDLDKDFLANPDKYYVLGSGGLMEKNWVNQHQGLATLLLAAAPFVGGAAGAAFGGGAGGAAGGAAEFADIGGQMGLPAGLSTGSIAIPGAIGAGAAGAAPELVGTTASLGTAGGEGAADVGAGAATAGGAGEAADIGMTAGLPEGLPGAAPHLLGPTVSAGAAPAGSFTPAAAAPLAPLPATQISLPPDSTKLPQGGSGKLDIVNTPGKVSYKEIADLIKAAGQGLGDANSAAQNNQMARANAQLLAAKGIEDAYLGDANLEDKQRRKELQDTYRQGVITTGQHSPFNPTPPMYGEDYKASSAALSRQGRTDLEKDPIYGIRNIPKPTDLYPDPKTAYAETGMQKVGDWLSPALSIAGSIPPSVYSKIFSWL